MENKTTTELIDLLTKLVDKDGKLKDGYEEAFEELKNREPFYFLLHEDYDESLPSLLREMEELREEVKLLKRHKHDIKSGDVMIRI